MSAVVVPVLTVAYLLVLTAALVIAVRLGADGNYGGAVIIAGAALLIVAGGVFYGVRA